MHCHPLNASGLEVIYLRLVLDHAELTDFERLAMGHLQSAAERQGLTVEPIMCSMAPLFWCD